MLIELDAPARVSQRHEKKKNNPESCDKSSRMIHTKHIENQRKHGRHNPPDRWLFDRHVLAIFRG